MVVQIHRRADSCFTRKVSPADLCCMPGSHSTTKSFNTALLSWITKKIFHLCSVNIGLVSSHILLKLMQLIYCRSEEHTSELQSRENLVCRLLLEKKNKANKL